MVTPKQIRYIYSLVLYREGLDLTCSVIWLAGVAIKAEQFYTTEFSFVL